LNHTRDPVGLALASIAAGATAGASVITGGIILLRILQGTQGGAEVSTAFAVLTVILLFGIALAVVTGWSLTKPLQETWRRGVIGALSFFGASLLAGLSAPVDMLGGRLGLSTYLTVLLVALVSTLRAARRAAAR
jgi:hypothetical protein